MTDHPMHLAATQERWLRLYYFARAAFSVLWVAAAFTLGQQTPSIAAVLLIVYPAWDALANTTDAAASGGLGRNRT
jgi:ABC-type transport system involved in cytochrome bd biosynthesis fused ATPase/permease subunit